MSKSIKMRYDYFDISAELHATWNQLCPVNEYRVLPAGELPSILPATLLGKVNSVLLMASGTPNGVVYYMANLNRVDARDQAIDQQPFGLAFLGTLPVDSGCLIQHGNWNDRTSYPPPEFWNHIQASGIGSVYPVAVLPSDSAGPIESLAHTTQGSAFTELVIQLKQLVDEQDGDD
jgi:hypothetical protein